MIFFTNKVTKILELIILLLISISSYGFVVTDLYNISIPVTQNQGPSQNKEELLSLGLNKLLVKLSGNSNIDDNEIIQEALKDPKQFLQEYQIIKNSEGRLDLRQVYNKMSIDSLISKAKITTWGVSRPLLLLWVLVEQDFGGRNLIIESEINDDISGLVKNQINDISNKRSVPIAWPIYDLDEQQSLKFKNLWNFDKTNILTLSEKYRPDVIVLGKIYPDGDSWVIKWLINDQTYIFDSKKESLELDITNSFNEMINLIAQEYASIPKKQDALASNIFYLKVTNVENMNKLIKLRDYLKNIKTITSSNLKELNDNTVTFEISLDNDKELFIKELKLERKLIKVNNDIDNNKILYYRWIS